KVSRGMLGVTIEPVDAIKAKALGLDSSRGALVNNVEGGSAAAKGGIEIGDVIVSINGQPVNSHADLPPMVGMLPPGTKARIGVVRDGKSREVNVTLDALTSDVQRLASGPAAGSSAGAAAEPLALIGLRVADLDAAARRQL